MSISLVAIVKNEEVMLPRCLDSLKDHVDEMVVVDTGSTDWTKTIAQSYDRYKSGNRRSPLQVKVLDFEWIDDFSAARNFGLAHAAGEWIIQLDADEELIAGSKFLPQLTADRDYDLFLLNCVIGPEKEAALSGKYPSSSVPRLFRNLPEIRYHSAIHESPRLPDQNRASYCPDVTILHFGPGYDTPDDYRQRQIRNTRILKKALSKSPDDGYLWAKLAGEYFHSENFAAALDGYERSIENTEDPYVKYLPAAHRNLVLCHLQTGRLDRALQALAAAKTKYPAYTDLHFLEGEIFLSIKQTAKALPAFKRCLELGDPPAGYDSWGGTGTWRAKEVLERISLFTGDAGKTL